MVQRRFIPCYGLLGLITLLGGCGGSTVELIPVTGTVTYQGAPVEGATVGFRCDAAKSVATGRTDAQGRFVLRTFGSGEGAVAGSHKVTVSKSSVPAEAASSSPSMEEMLKAKPPSRDAKPKNLLPEKYADAARSNLEFTVSRDGSNDFQIDLTD